MVPYDIRWKLFLLRLNKSQMLKSAIKLDALTSSSFSVFFAQHSWFVFRSAQAHQPCDQNPCTERHAAKLAACPVNSWSRPRESYWQTLSHSEKRTSQKVVMVVTWAKIRLVNRLNGIKIQKLQLIETYDCRNWFDQVWFSLFNN